MIDVVLKPASGATNVAVAVHCADGVLSVAAPGNDEVDLDWLKTEGFAAKRSEVLVSRAPGAPSVVYLGLGDRGPAKPDAWRRAGAALARTGTGTVSIHGPDDPRCLGALAEGLVLGSYHYGRYKSKEVPTKLEGVDIVAEDSEINRRALARALQLASSVCWARDLGNEPPNVLTPRVMADQIADELGGAGIEVEVWDEKRIAAERLGGLLGVAQGSSQPPRLVFARYEPNCGATTHVVLVGKGITFDSGGLNIKSFEGMMQMKTDMAGAAAVMAVMRYLGYVTPALKVTAICPLTENMPGPAAARPGDVLITRDGQSIEVLNTDAEGRLVLADALALAAELEPDVIIDLATLTTSAVGGLGRSFAPLYGNDAALIEKLWAIGRHLGERLWPMPLPTDYSDHIDSDVADMKNTGVTGQAGIAGALLLHKFVGNTVWAHLDIAATARSTEQSGYLSKGATGFAIRTVAQYLTELDPTFDLDPTLDKV